MYKEYMKIAVIVIFYALFIGVILITTAVGRWFVFKKLGMPGWKGIIPFYGQSLLFRRFWTIKMFWVYLATHIGYFVMCAEIPVLGFLGFFRDVGTVAGILFGLVFLAILYGGLAAICVINFKLYRRLAKSFGRTAGFAAGLTFIPPVFFIILGLSRSD